MGIRNLPDRHPVWFTLGSLALAALVFFGTSGLLWAIAPTSPPPPPDWPLFSPTPTPALPPPYTPPPFRYTMPPAPYWATHTTAPVIEPSPGHSHTHKSPETPEPHPGPTVTVTLPVPTPPVITTSPPPITPTTLPPTP